MFHYAKNKNLEIAVRQPGAEICSIKSLKTGLEYMWGGDPKVWNSTAPLLFPIIGSVKEDSFLWEGEKYSMPKHGIIRDNPAMLLTGITADSLTFGMKSDKETRKRYPFEFEFNVQFQLEGNKVITSHQVINTGTSTLWFSVGGHPGFKCPIHEAEKYEDYYLEFEKPETVSTWLLLENGLLSDVTEPVLNGSNILPLTHELFSKDALIFKDLKSRKVTLKSKNSAESLSVTFEDFPYLGIWAKTNGDYVCIEPWLGIADSWDSNQRFEEKDGILSLPAGETFEASYVIEVHE